jgi:hypothetical protein
VFEEVYDERVHVLAPLAQGRELDGEDREAVVEVASERALLDGALQVYVRRRDDAHVGAQHLVRADARELAVLKHPQQAHLRRQAHLAYLVEEERAAVGLLEAPASALARVGERAALVAEEFRLQERLGDGATVELDVRPLLAPRVVVDEVGE